MSALNMAIEAYAKHAMLSIDDVKQLISAGDARTCNTVSTIRIRYEASAA